MQSVVIVNAIHKKTNIALKKEIDYRMYKQFASDQERVTESAIWRIMELQLDALTDIMFPELVREEDDRKSS